MKKIILAAIMILTAMDLSVFAQTIEEGKKFMYYERFTSAKQVFEKLVKAKPENEEAIYWLGQSMIAPDEHTAADVENAKTLYLNALAKNSSSALLLAGVGHIELLEGKTQDARSHFETAVSLSQGKNIAVLKAIGFANGNPDAKNGDAAYAIDKLKRATEIKGFKDPSVWVDLGDAYRKFADGGNAIQSYQAALNVDPNYARAMYRMGKVYETQGKAQEDLFLQYYNDAIAKDPNYGPVYANLFNYYYSTNVPLAAQYMEKMLNVSDADPKACYYRAQLLYVQGLFQEALKKVDECLAEGGKEPYPNLYGIKAYAYKRLSDSVNAKSAFEQFFKKQSADKIGSGDYAAYVNILLKFPGMEEEAGKWTEMAIAADSLIANKVNYIKTMALALDAQKKYRESAEWYRKVLAVKPNYGKTDLYNVGYGYYKAGDFTTAIETFNAYVQKYPSETFGYYMLGQATAATDSANLKGLAAPHYQKLLEIGEAENDKTKIKAQMVTAYLYFMDYYFNVKKDKDSALVYVDKALVLVPNDEQLLSNKKIITEAKTPARKPMAPKEPTQRQ